MMGLKYLLVCLVLILGLGVASPVSAVSPSSILVDVSPENPSPNSNVNISLRSYAANLDTVSITWIVNEKTVTSGIGKKEFSVTVGASGSSTTVRAKIYLPDGEIEKTINLKPSQMLLLWQANDSYVPAFYKGKALPVADSKIKVVAMPDFRNSNGTTVSPKNVSYFWQKNYSNDQSASGYGKNYFLYNHNFLDNANNISVEAITPDQKSSASSQINIDVVTPEIVFYPQITGTGVIWENAISDNHQISGGETIVAIPYFIAPKDIRRPDLIWNWYINDIPVETRNARKNILSLVVGREETGVSKLKLEIENQYKIFQSSRKEISIQF